MLYVVKSWRETGYRKSLQNYTSWATNNLIYGGVQVKSITKSVLPED